MDGKATELITVLAQSDDFDKLVANLSQLCDRWGVDGEYIHLHSSVGLLAPNATLHKLANYILANEDTKG